MDLGLLNAGQMLSPTEPLELWHWSRGQRRIDGSSIGAEDNSSGRFCTQQIHNTNESIKPSHCLFLPHCNITKGTDITRMLPTSIPSSPPIPPFLPHYNITKAKINHPLFLFPPPSSPFLPSSSSSLPSSSLPSTGVQCNAGTIHAYRRGFSVSLFHH